MDTVWHGELVSYRLEIEVRARAGGSWSGVKSSPVTAALTLSLTGRYARQGTEAAEGVRLWAGASGVQLTLVDDQGSKEVALQAYRGWIDTRDLLIGPYASGLVRAIAPLVRDAGRVLWNHGGSADDLAQPGIASLPAPASSYFDGVVHEAADRKVSRLIVVQAPGPFARAVADGARARASDRGVAAEGVLGPVQWWPTADTPKIGPSGTDFVTQSQRRTGREPSYPAAQAAAAGYLAQAAHGLGLEATEVPEWTTSTLLGDFALDDAWRQVGHRVTTVRWQCGRMVPIAH